MSIITWPATLKAPAECTLSQARYDMLENSDATGSQAARLFGPPRWRMALRSIDAFTLAEAGQYEAMLLKLRGGVNHLAMHDPVRAAPQGTLRGSPVLAANASAGAVSVVLAGCIWDRQHLLSGSFETDTNADGMADSWMLYSSGLAGTVTAGPGTVGAGVRAQRVSATALNTGPASEAGATQMAQGIVAGKTYTLSVDALCSTACMVGVTIEWQTIGGSVISYSTASSAGSTVAYARHAVTGIAPATAAKARVFLTMHSAGSLGAASLDLENAQLEVGSAYSGFAPGATLLAGDWLQIGSGLGTSQLVKAVADAAAAESGAMTVTFEPPLRKAHLAAVAVTWDKPVAYYKQTSVPQWGYRPAMRYKQGGFALDLLESWS